MDLRTALATQGYSATRPVTEPSAVQQPGLMSQAAQDFASVLAEGESTAISALQSEASPHALVQALSETEFAVEATVTIRDKVVEAYQEILRMPV